MITLEEIQALNKRLQELEERVQQLEKKTPNKKIITDYTSSMVQDYILEDQLRKKKGGNF